jgi:UDP-glucose 4-epimerase
MKILVTGGAGFVASHIVDAYVADGHDVTVIDDLSTGVKRNVNPKANFVPMDVRDPNLITLFAKSKFEIVNHHAAQIDVRKSVQDPFLDASINVLGTLRLLDCCRTYGVRKFVFSSSGGTVYGECPDRPAREDDPMRPESPYGFSKATAETYIRFYGLHYKLPYTVLRYGNVYGPRQDPSGEAGVVAIFAGRMLDHDQVTIFGDGKQERDFVSVFDVVSANQAVLLKGENETINVGSGEALSVLKLFEQLSKIAKSDKKPVFAPERRGELRRNVLDVSKAQRVLGWKGARSLEKGLAETYDYFAKHRKTPAKNG